MAMAIMTRPEILLLQKCSELQEVRQLHAQFVVSGLIHHHRMVPRSLIQAYVNTSNVEPAISIFETSLLVPPDVFVYNTIIRGLLTHDDSPARILQYYNQLLLQHLLPDNYTYTFMLKACSRLMYASSGCMDDAELVLAEFGQDEENVDATNSIISGYCKCGLVVEARDKFDGMRHRDVASWSAMITGYTRNQMNMEALSLFHYMTVIEPETLPNESMLVSLLTACGRLGALAQGRWIHKYIDRVGIKNTASLSTAILDMYAKCGSIECSYTMFKKMASRDRDVVSWGAMISGFAIHGQATKCLRLFDEMIGYGIRPNAVVFVAVLTACSRSGLVEKGRHYFQQMVHRFRITPSIEHYGCMVDMLARVGRLEEASEVIELIPEKANSVILGAFLSGCRMHNDVVRGSWAFRKLMEVEPESGDRCKMGEVMFASAGRKNEATTIRRLMDAERMDRTAGCSFIELDGTVHQFIAGDIMHDQTEEIYRICCSINTTIRRE
ncbi:Pentatricopeptide repeat-containing protein At5g66520 [Linum grandiflorum]